MQLCQKILENKDFLIKIINRPVFQLKKRGKMRG